MSRSHNRRFLPLLIFTNLRGLLRTHHADQLLTAARIPFATSHSNFVGLGELNDNRFRFSSEFILLTLIKKVTG